MARTKKVGSTGRFGSRYGAKLRRRVLDIENRRHEPTRCPACATRSLKRKAAGLWTCKKCGHLFTGGAYVPFTDAGKAARRAIAQRLSDDFLALRGDDEEFEVDFMSPSKKPTAVIVATDAEDEFLLPERSDIAETEEEV